MESSDILTVGHPLPRTSTVTSLKRQLGFRTAVAFIVGEVIAVGIFLTPSGMAKSLGSPFWLLVVWLIMGGMAFCGALCYGELASRFPEAGGGYVYLREAYGRAIAFLYGWMALLVMDPGLTAALAVGLASYAGYVFGLGSVEVKLVAVAAIVTIAIVNIRGVKFGGWLVTSLTILKLGLLSLVIAWSFATQSGNWSNFQPFFDQRVGSEPLIAALAGGIVGAFFSFGGWWDLSKLAGEVRDPERTLPRALLAGVTILTLVYILTSAAFIYLVPLERVTSGEIFVAQAGEAMFGRAGGNMLSAVVIVAVFGSLAAVVMSAPRVYFAMARDGLFIPAAAAVHQRFGTPARAILIQATLASVLVILGSFDAIISYFIFVVVIFLGLTVAALFIFRKRDSQSGGISFTPAYPLPPVVFLLLTVLILVLIGGRRPREAILGVVVVLLGLPVYYFVLREKKYMRRNNSL